MLLFFIICEVLSMVGPIAIARRDRRRRCQKCGAYLTPQTQFFDPGQSPLRYCRTANEHTAFLITNEVSFALYSPIVPSAPSRARSSEPHPYPISSCKVRGPKVGYHSLEGTTCARRRSGGVCGKGHRSLHKDRVSDLKHDNDVTCRWLDNGTFWLVSG